MRFIPVVIAALAAATALPAPAEAPLALREAQRLAVERSRSLAAQRLAIGSARDLAVAAGRRPDPVVSLGIENLPVEGRDKFELGAEAMTMKRVGVMQELTSRDKRALRSERYALEAAKGEAQRLATLAAIQRDTAIAWMDAWHAERMAALLAEQRLRGLQEAQAAEAEYRAGRGSQSGVLAAHAGLALLDDRAAELQRQVRTARTTLARWVGEGADRPLAERPDIGQVHLEDHGLEEALQQHPQIEVLARQQQIAHTEARLARANRDPDWSVEVAYGERAARFGDMVSVGVSIPLPWDRANRQDRELAAKLAQAAQAEAERDEALREHVAEVQAMVHEWQSLRTRVARFEREIVPLAAARADAADAAYRGGKSSPSELLAARRAELEARLQALELEARGARLWAQLTYLIPEDAK